MRQKKMEKKLKSVNIVKELGEGVTEPDVRDLDRDMHNISPHLTRQRVAPTLPSEIMESISSSEFLIYITPFVQIFASTMGQFSEMRIIFCHLQIALL